MTRPEPAVDDAIPTPDRTVLQGGRLKTYRPLPLTERQAALDEALAAWARGDFFETHELLEPAWMGTADEAERELYQGLIKLAAAFVHEVRGNRAGVAKSLAGARRRLGGVAAVTPRVDGIDVAALVARIDTLSAGLGGGLLTPPIIDRSTR
jgi:uncharacterized protein